MRSSYPLFTQMFDCSFPLEILMVFIIFEILLCVAATIKNIFCAGNGLSLTYLSVAPKFYSSLMPLNEVWPRLHPKYFGKLSHIYHLSIVRLYLWKIEVCRPWGELRSHYPISWLPFLWRKFGKFHYFWNSLLCSSNY